MLFCLCLLLEQIGRSLRRCSAEVATQNLCSLVSQGTLRANNGLVFYIFDLLLLFAIKQFKNICLNFFYLILNLPSRFVESYQISYMVLTIYHFSYQIHLELEQLFNEKQINKHNLIDST